MTVVRCAMTQTRNVYEPMPATVDDLESLAPTLEEIRRANVDHHVALIERAREQGAVAIGLGELFPAPYFALRRDAFWREMAEDAANGPTVTTLRETAKRLGIVVVAPIYERAADGRFNTAVVIDADGSVLGRHRKCHIPQGANEQGAFDERFYYEPSNGAHGFFPVFDTTAGKIGVSICYDRHFEGVVSALAGGGAQIIFSPAVTFGAKSRRLWDLEFEVDAVRNRVFIGGSNRLGAEPPWNQEYFGASYFVGPEGRVPDASDDDRLVIADIDLAALSAEDPSGWNLARDARPDIY
jgi:N-carbamoylputrescine amidase